MLKFVLSTIYEYQLPKFYCCCGIPLHSTLSTTINLLLDSFHSKTHYILVIMSGTDPRDGKTGEVCDGCHRKWRRLKRHQLTCNVYKAQVECRHGLESPLLLSGELISP